MTRLPTTLYIALGNYGPTLNTGRVDIGALDPTENIEDAADQLWEIEGNTGFDGRVLEISFDFATNAPESVRDVTEDCVKILRKRTALAAE